MLNFQKISAACKGEILAEYYGGEQTAQADPSGVDPAGRELESGDWLTAYYAARDERARFRQDMTRAVADALGISPARSPTSDELKNLFEARRADTGEAWSKQKREISSFDFVFAPHKSVSLAAQFAALPAEAAAIRNALVAANDDALRYAAADLGFTRRGHGGEKGLERGDIGWFTFRHDAARPTLALQDGRDGATYLVDAPMAGDPHFHLHNIIPNLVVTDDGHVGAIDARTLTADRVLEYGAYFQARLADRLRALGARVAYDEDEQAVVLVDIPRQAVDLFSKRDRQILGDAKKYVADKDIDWDALSVEDKKKILREESRAGRLGKTKEDERELWLQQAAEIGWSHNGVMGKIAHARLSEAERFDLAYRYAAKHLAREFVTAAVLDYDRLRVHAARGLIAAGMNEEDGRRDIDRVVALLEQRGVEFEGAPAALVKGRLAGKLCVTHRRQVEIEQNLCAHAQRASADRSGALAVEAIRDAMRAASMDDDIAFTEEQTAAIHAMGRGSRLTLLTGVAGSGKTTLLRPLVSAWKANGRRIVGVSTAWRQADALKDADIAETSALQPFLKAIERGDFRPDRKTVLVIDEVSQIGPRPMLKLLELQAATGMTIKMLGDREQCQSIEAGDTIELLRRVLPKSALPEILSAVRQTDPRDREIALLFREGRAPEALDMKRQDGTARLLDGDYDQVVGQIADFYIERTDNLRMIDKALGVTITTLTNAEAGDVSQAIRVRLKQRGSIGGDETIHKAVYYRGDKAEFFDLPIATGDKLRLYRRTFATIDGRGAAIGNNGDVVDVVGKTKDGLLLRNARGKVGAVEWRRLTDSATGRLNLGYGRAFTIDAAQGMSNKGEHINALARGTAGSNAFKIYPSESRASGRTFTLVSKAAVDADIVRRRALGDKTQIDDDDRWERVADNMSEKPYKRLAIDLVRRARRGRQRALDQSIASRWSLESAATVRPNLLREAQGRIDSAAAGAAFLRRRAQFDEAVDRCAIMLQDAADLVARGLRATRPGSAVTTRPAADPAPPPAPAAASAPASQQEIEPPAPRRPSPSPGM